MVESSTLAIAGQEGRGSKPTKTKTAVTRARNLYAHRRREPSYRWAVFKRQAKRRNHEVDLRRHEFVALASRSTCTYCGGTAEYMGLDRVQNDQGYALGNVVPCCAACNFMKGKLTLRSFVERTRIIGRKFMVNCSVAARGRSDVTCCMASGCRRTLNLLSESNIN